MFEPVGHYGSAQEAERNMIKLHQLLDFVVAQTLDGKLTYTQLEHLDAYDGLNVDLLEPEPAKQDDYYPAVINALQHRGREFADATDEEIQNAWERVCPDQPCPAHLLEVREYIQPGIIAKRGLASAVGTTGLHLHTSGESVTETIDLFIDMAYREGALRQEAPDRYHQQMLKSDKRHVSFGALVSLRYWISKKSENYLRERRGRAPGNEVDQSMQPDADDKLSDPISRDLANKNLLHPKLRVLEPMVGGYDPEHSFNCRLHEQIEQAVVDQIDPDQLKQQLAQQVISYYFSEADAIKVWEAYQRGDEKLPEGVQIRRSHGDIVLKAPGGNLTVELRSPDARPEGMTKEQIDAQLKQGQDPQMSGAIEFVRSSDGIVARRFKTGKQLASLL